MITERALWIVERNSERALSLNDIAAACGVSRSHLANAFGMATGWPVVRYLKARRLTEAAHRLAGGAPDILTVALEHGYGSHEAFTRAFREQFGLPPEQVRSRGTVEGIATTAPLRLSGASRGPLKPRLEMLEPMKLTGLAAACTYNETILIPAQWQRFMGTHYEDIPNKLERMPIGMCEPPDDEGAFRYVCAAAVSAFDRGPSELVQFELKRGPYAVFAHDDHASTIFGTYATIWNESLPAMGARAADGPVLEFHNDNFDPGTGLGGLTIWVPLEAEA